MQGSKYNQHYEDFVKLVPNPELRFMNYGFSEGVDIDDFNEVPKEFWKQRYNVNFIRFLLKGCQLKGKKILDVGCGRGGACSYMAAYTELEVIHGIDFSRGNISFCNENYKHPKLEFFHGDAHQLPFKDNTYDLILNLESSHGYPDRDRFLQSVSRVLKPGGMFLYADGLPQASLKEHHRKLQKLPFELLESSNITPHVLMSLKQMEGDLSTILRSSILEDRSNEEPIEAFIKTLFVDAFGAFKAGMYEYWYWKLKKKFLN